MLKWKKSYEVKEDMKKSESETNKKANEFDKKDILKEILFLLLKMVFFFAWWCFTLAIVSLLFMQVWKLEWQQMLVLAVVLTVVTTVGHVISKIKNK